MTELAQLAWPFAFIVLGFLAWDAWRRRLAFHTGDLSSRILAVDALASANRTGLEFARRQLDEVAKRLDDYIHNHGAVHERVRSELDELQEARAAHNTQIVGLSAEAKNEVRRAHERIQVVHEDLAKFSALTQKEFERISGKQSIVNAANAFMPSPGKTGQAPF